MILEKDTLQMQQIDAVPPDENPEEQQNGFLAELQKLAWLTFSMVILLSLVSYSPDDPSFTTSKTVGAEGVENWMGVFGSFVSDLLLLTVGLAAMLIPLIISGFALSQFSKNGTRRVIGLVLLLVGASIGLQAALPRMLLPDSVQNGGGLLGLILYKELRYYLGPLGAILLGTSTTLGSIIVLFDRVAIITFVTRLRVAIANLKAQSAENVQVDQGEPIEPLLQGDEYPSDSEGFDTPSDVDVSPEHRPKIGFFSRKFSRAKAKQFVPPKNYTLPSIKMLSGRAQSKVKPVEKSWYLEKGQTLVEKLKDFGVEGEIVNISPGPVITVYEFKPASGVKIRDIANLSDDLTLALSALSVRIVAPIPGKPVVGIEIPSPNRETVFFKDVIQETPFYGPELNIPIALGRMASGEPMLADLATMPHLLIAGATGTGKSVFINTLITGLIYRFAPTQLKMILVDPKMVELSTYEGIPHLLLPVVVDSKKAVLALRWLVNEMERRYTLMHQMGVRHVDGYNAKISDLKKSNIPEAAEFEFLPYIVTVIDEYADLMAVVPKEVELSITRLAQKARASGIYIVLATQRPSTDVVTGIIKANFPSRISFRVASGVDSKTILDRAGAERLLGHGDLLFLSPGFTTLKRLQGPYIADKDLHLVVDYVKTQALPEYDESILNPPEGIDEALNGPADEKDNELYDAAVRLVTEKGEASVSLIQRHFRIGYNRAATIVEQMEKDGVIGQATGTSKRRQVIARAL